MEISDILLHIVNKIKLDEDKNLTLMHLSWTNKHYHNFVKPLIEIDEVVLLPYEGDISILGQINSYGHYNPYFVKISRPNNIVRKVDPIFYKKKCVIIKYYSELCYEDIEYDFEKYYSSILEKIGTHDPQLLIKEYEYGKKLKKSIQSSTTVLSF
jgi:hypothetical protein